MHSTSTEKMAALLVSASFVNIPSTPSLAEEPAGRSCLAGQVVSRVASPNLGGGQVAVLRLRAASSRHVTSAAYSCLRGVYVPRSTKCCEAQCRPSRGRMEVSLPGQRSRTPPPRDRLVRHRSHLGQ